MSKILLIIKYELSFENYNQVKATSTIMRFSIPQDYILEIGTGIEK